MTMRRSKKSHSINSIHYKWEFCPGCIEMMDMYWIGSGDTNFVSDADNTLQQENLQKEELEKE